MSTLRQFLNIFTAVIVLMIVLLTVAQAAVPETATQTQYETVHTSND